MHAAKISSPPSVMMNAGTPLALDQRSHRNQMSDTANVVSTASQTGHGPRNDSTSPDAAFHVIPLMISTAASPPVNPTPLPTDQIDMAGQNDEQHAQRQHRGDRQLDRHQRQVARLGERTGRAEVEEQARWRSARSASKNRGWKRTSRLTLAAWRVLPCPPAMDVAGRDHPSFASERFSSQIDSVGAKREATEGGMHGNAADAMAER